jgi:hypothetical protein
VTQPTQEDHRIAARCLDSEYAQAVEIISEYRQDCQRQLVLRLVALLDIGERYEDVVSKLVGHAK